MVHPEPLKHAILGSRESGRDGGYPVAMIEADVLVVGAGAAGLAAAISLAAHGCRVACVGAVDTAPNGRTVALFEGSLRHLHTIGAWDAVAPAAAPLRRIRMVDETRSRFSVPTVLFSADEIGLDAFGANVENDVLVRLLVAHAATLPNLSLHDDLLESVDFEAEVVTALAASGTRFHARLVVAADGRNSVARRAARIGARPWTYPQSAITALVAHARPHGGTSTEFHTREGPCTLVPLNGRGDHPHRSSLVWLMRPTEAARRATLGDAALARELETQVHRLLGPMQIDGARGMFPMAGMRVTRLTGHRIALVGEAAHVFPPLAAQGLNLSLRDAATLAEVVGAARAAGHGHRRGGLSSTATRGSAGGDVSVRTSGIDILNRSLLADLAPVDLARAVGMAAFSAIGPLRRAIMREGVLPFGARGAQPERRRAGVQ